MAVNLEEFHRLQRVTEQEGRQITPWEWQQVNGAASDYSKLYGTTAWYDQNGNLTQAGQASGGKAAAALNINPNDNRQINGITGNRTQNITGVDVNASGMAIPGSTNVDTASNAISAQDDAARVAIERQIQTNRVNQSGPYGSTTWQRDPVTGAMTQSTSLGPWEQRKYEQQAGQDFYQGEIGQGKLDQIANQGEFSYGGIKDTIGQDQLTSERQRLEDALMSNFETRNKAQFDREAQNLEQTIADRGLDPTGEAAKELRAQMGQRQSDARQNAMTEASKLGGEELGRTYGISADIRNRQTTEYGTQRNAPYNEYSALRGGQSGLQTPDVAPISDIEVSAVNPGAIGQGYGEIEASKYLGELDAKTRENVANIQANASMYGADASNESGNPGGVMVNFPDSTTSTAKTRTRAKTTSGKSGNSNTAFGQSKSLFGTPAYY